jgi:hypothetical protein
MIIRPSYCLALAGLVSTVAASPGNTDLEVDKRLTCHQGCLVCRSRDELMVTSVPYWRRSYRLGTD